MAEKRHKLPTETEFIQEITARAANLPNCEMMHKTVIKSGPKTYKFAVVLQFTDPKTGDVTHRELRLNSYPFRVATGIDYSEDNRLARWSCRDQEIERLRLFLENYQGITQPGKHRVVPSDMAAAFEQFVKALGSADLKTPQLMELIGVLAERASDLRSLPELGESGKLRMVAGRNVSIGLRQLRYEISVVR
jgi:hypothetical protein